MQINKPCVVIGVRAKLGFAQKKAVLGKGYGALGAQGGGNFYDGWMKDPHSAMISCNDGFRPVSFYIEALEEAPMVILREVAMDEQSLAKKQYLINFLNSNEYVNVFGNDEYSVFVIGKEQLQ